MPTNVLDEPLNLDTGLMFSGPSSEATAIGTQSGAGRGSTTVGYSELNDTDWTVNSVRGTEARQGSYALHANTGSLSHCNSTNDSFAS